MGDKILMIVFVILVGSLGWYSGYTSGKTDAILRYEKIYREMCARLIEALRRRDDD